MLKEIRIHGRGGQGSVTAAEVLAKAAFKDGLESQAFPAFGSERMGAPVRAFCRVSDKPIRARSEIHNPDYCIVQDPSLLETVNVFEGLKAGGMVDPELREARGGQGPRRGDRSRPWPARASPRKSSGVRSRTWS